MDIKSTKSKMPQDVKEEIAKELGIYDTVIKDGGFGNVTSRNCGNIVARGVARAGKKLEEK